MKLETEALINGKDFSIGMQFPTRGGRKMDVIFNISIAERYNVSFLQRFATPKGDATVIGYGAVYLWFWIDGQEGISYWDNLDFDVPKFFDYKPPQSNTYPDELDQILINLFGHNAHTLVTRTNLVNLNAEGIFNNLFHNLDIDLINEKNLEKTENYLNDFFNKNPIRFTESILNFFEIIENKILQKFDSNYFHFEQKSLVTILNQIEQQSISFQGLFPKRSNLPQNSPYQEVVTNLTSLKKLVSELIQKQADLPKLNQNISMIEINLTEKYHQLFAFALNYFLDFRKCFSESLTHQTCFSQIAKELGRLVHDHGSTLFAETTMVKLEETQNELITIKASEEEKNTLKEMADKKFMIAFIFFTLAGIDNTDTRKKACYMHFCKENGLPEEFNLELFSKQKSDKFEHLYDFLTKHELFQDRMKMAVKNNCVFAQFQLIQFIQLYADHKELKAIETTNQAINETNKANLLTLLDQFIEANFDEHHQNLYLQIIQFAKTYFKADFDIMVRVATLYDSMKDEKYLEVLKKINRNELDINTNISSQVIYAELLLKTSERVNHQQALRILSGHFKQNDLTLLGKLNHYKTTPAIAVTLAYFYLEVAEQNPSSAILNFLKNIDTGEYIAEANYLYFKIQFMLHGLTDSNADILDCLVKAVKHSFQPALDELLILANEHHNHYVRYLLGEIYCEGLGVSKNIDLAVNFFEQSNYQKAKFKLAQLVLNKTINGDVNPVPGLKALLNCENEIRLRALIYLNDLSRLEKYRSEAILAVRSSEETSIKAFKTHSIFSSRSVSNVESHILFVTQKNATFTKLVDFYNVTVNSIIREYIQEKLAQMNNLQSMKDLKKLHLELAANHIDIDSEDMRILRSNLK